MTGLLARRTLLMSCAACLVAPAIPAIAKSGTVFDREIVPFSPEPDGGLIAERFNQLVARLSADGGGTIRLSAGVFPTDRQLYILDNIRVCGEGQERSIFRLVSSAPAFGSRAGILRAKRPRVPLALRFVQNTVLEHFTIDGNRAGQRADVYDAEKKYGFYGETRDCVMRFVTIRDCMGYGFDPHGAVDDAPSERMIIEDCHAYGNLKDGFTLDRQVDMIFRRNLSERNDRAGVNVVTTTLRTLIANNVVRDNRGTGITVQNGSGTLEIIENEVSGNALEGIYLRVSDNLLVSGNHIHGNGRAGIRVRGGHTIAIDVNTIGNNLRDPNSGQSEVHLDAYKGDGATGVLVVENAIRATRNGAVWEGNGATRNQVLNNAFASRSDGIRLTSNASVARGNVERLY